MNVTTQATPENGGGGDVGGNDLARLKGEPGLNYGGGSSNPFSGFAPPKAPGNHGSGGGTNTTMAVGENGGGYSNGQTITPPRRPDPKPYTGRGDGGRNIQDLMDTFYGPNGGGKDRGPMVSTNAVPENGGGETINPNRPFPGPSRPPGGDRGPIATTGAVGENGGGGRSPRPPKGPEGFPAPGSPGGGTVINRPGLESVSGGGRQPRPDRQPTGGRSPRPNPSPSPGPKREARQAERSKNQDLRVKNQAARADKREERTERRAERADKKAQKAKAQRFKDKRMKRITGKDSMPNN